jgi:hypothetical protein
MARARNKYPAWLAVLVAALALAGHASASRPALNTTDRVENRQLQAAAQSGEGRGCALHPTHAFRWAAGVQQESFCAWPQDLCTWGRAHRFRPQKTTGYSDSAHVVMCGANVLQQVVRHCCSIALMSCLSAHLHASRPHTQ